MGSQTRDEKRVRQESTTLYCDVPTAWHLLFHYGDAIPPIIIHNISLFGNLLGTHIMHALQTARSPTCSLTVAYYYCDDCYSTFRCSHSVSFLPPHFCLFRCKTTYKTPVIPLGFVIVLFFHYFYGTLAFHLQTKTRCCANTHDEA